MTNDTYNSLDLKGGRKVAPGELTNTRTTMRFNSQRPDPRTQSTPVQKHIAPAQPATKVVAIPMSIVYALCFGCMAIALIGALAGAFTR